MIRYSNKSSDPLTFQNNIMFLRGVPILLTAYCSKPLAFFLAASNLSFFSFILNICALATLDILLLFFQKMELKLRSRGPKNIHVKTAATFESNA